MKAVENAASTIRVIRENAKTSRNMTLNGAEVVRLSAALTELMQANCAHPVFHQFTRECTTCGAIA